MDIFREERPQKTISGTMQVISRQLDRACFGKIERQIWPNYSGYLTDANCSLLMLITQRNGFMDPQGRGGGSPHNELITPYFCLGSLFPFSYSVMDVMVAAHQSVVLPVVFSLWVVSSGNLFQLFSALCSCCAFEGHVQEPHLEGNIPPCGRCLGPMICITWVHLFVEATLGVVFWSPFKTHPKRGPLI